MVKVLLEVISVVGFEVEGSILAILEPVSCALNSVDKVRTFIPFLQSGGHISFNNVLPNKDKISYVEGR